MIARMLAKVPAQRPASADYVKRELGHIRNRLQTDATHVTDYRPTATPVKGVPALQDIPPTREHTNVDPVRSAPSAPAPLIQPMQQQQPHEEIVVRTLEYGLGQQLSSPKQRVSRVSRADLPKDIRVSKARRKRRFTGLKVAAALVGVTLLGGVAFLFAFPQAAASLPFKLPFLPGGAAVEIPGPLPNTPDKPEPAKEPDPDEPKVDVKPGPGKGDPTKPVPDMVKVDPARPDQPKKLVPKPKPVKEPPTTQQLVRRVNQLLAPLEQKKAAGGDVDNLKYQLLIKLRESAVAATSAEKRAEVEKDLKDAETNFR
jgi:hypothetical protein